MDVGKLVTYRQTLQADGLRIIALREGLHELAE
jgi:hypothetical protein